jgi:transmembrane sensor
LEEKDYLLLYKKYLNGNCSQEELSLLFTYFKAADGESLNKIIQNNFEHIEDKHQASLEEEQILNSVFVKVKSNTHPIGNTIIRSLWSRWSPYTKIAAAAIVLFTLTFSLYRYERTRPIDKEQLRKFVDVAPGGNKATLRLPNGKIISLEADKNEIVMNANEIVYGDGTKITNDHTAVRTPQLVTLTTPNAGQYKVVLPDGSRVWLNSASSLTYPTNFIGDERRVILTGEAYFEVETTLINALNQNRKMPFIVESNSQEVKVLGTRFNINCYADEPDIKTTLVEGSVHISIPNTLYSAILKPNQQSTIDPNNNDQIKVKNIKPSRVIAWRDGLFQFYETDINTVMRQISRWYDVEVSYEGRIKYDPFYGEIERNYNLSEVLKVLELGGVHFRMEVNNGKKQIIVTN